MTLVYQESGTLAEGIHQISWDEFVAEFGYTNHRMELVNGLSMALSDLHSCGCTKVYVDGSFVTKSIHPNDYDACWEHDGVDQASLKERFPLFFDFNKGRMNQKQYYKGEIFPARMHFTRQLLCIDFFQLGRDDNKKGIISLIL